MKAFHFPLETALTWRKTRLEAEEARLARLAAECERIRAEARENRESGARAEREITHAPAATALELWALDGYRQAVTTRARAFEERLGAVGKLMAAQRARVEEARRELRLLENLKARRRAAWQREADREIENFAGDSYLARWNREARRAARASANLRTAGPGGKAPR
jgi:flagellar export protein FliJ